MPCYWQENPRGGNFIHYLSTFLAGLVVGFVSAWKPALFSRAVIPGIAFAEKTVAARSWRVTLVFYLQF
ncbi:hypothetical protein AgCh_021562 [Apium graveolens]